MLYTKIRNRIQATTSASPVSMVVPRADAERELLLSGDCMITFKSYLSLVYYFIINNHLYLYSTKAEGLLVANRKAESG